MEFDAAYKRICEVLGVRTHAQVGAAFGCRVGAVSAAKLRGAIPKKWLVKLSMGWNVNPRWVLTGEGPERVHSMAEPSQGDDVHGCLSRLRPGEPIFVLRAQDMLAPALVALWAELALMHGCPLAKVEEAGDIAVRMNIWASEHGGKWPD